MGLLDDALNPAAQKVRCFSYGIPAAINFAPQRSHIVETEPFKGTFGPKAQRKKPRLDVGSFEELGLAGNASSSVEQLPDDIGLTEGVFFAQHGNPLLN